jgi:translation initiation factor 1
MKRNNTSATALVYTTGKGKICPDCNQPTTACTCAKRSAPPAGDGIVRVRRETKGRKGAGVTVITGLPLDAAQLKELAGYLKKKCGSGGTVKEGVIEIQGDHRDLLVTELQRRNWTVKRAGG